MSATILDKEMFCDQVGIDPDQASFIRVGCPFPVRSRPLHYIPIGKVSGTDSHIGSRLAQAVDRIAERHPGERGIIHTVSYKFAKAIMEGSHHKDRLITHDAANRIAQLEQFKATPGSILVSPSMTTGVDLPYDLCRWQVICKLAFPDKSDPQVAKRMDRKKPKWLQGHETQGSRWYQWVTACALVQTYGRGVRRADDACVTYLLDGNWGAFFYDATWRMLPKWFLDAVQYREDLLVAA